MATTAQDVFDIAIGLMNEVDESSGKTDVSANKDFKQRALLILTALRNELYPYSDNWRQAVPNKRPVCGAVTDFDMALGIDDVLCQTILPYGLAAQLLLDDNPTAAAFFEQRYEELMAKLRNVPSEFLPIESAYGGGEYCGYSRW